MPLDRAETSTAVALGRLQSGCRNATRDDLRPAVPVQIARYDRAAMGQDRNNRIERSVPPAAPVALVRDDVQVAVAVDVGARPCEVQIHSRESPAIFESHGVVDASM